MVLNSRSEYSRCKIGRLTLEHLDNIKGMQEEDGSDKGEEQEVDWSDILMRKQREMDREIVRGRGTNQLNVGNIKRKDRADTKQNNRRVKRRKYALLGEDWGLLEAKSTFEVAPDPMRGQTKTPV